MHSVSVLRICNPQGGQVNLWMGFRGISRSEAKPPYPIYRYTSTVAIPLFRACIAIGIQRLPVRCRA